MVSVSSVETWIKTKPAMLHSTRSSAQNVFFIKYNAMKGSLGNRRALLTAATQGRECFPLATLKF